MIIYAVGDIHGCYDQYKEMMRQIYDDFAEIKLREPHLVTERPKIVFLGDYVDRGPDSKKVIISLMNQKIADDDFDREFLMGNHEDMMLHDPVNWMHNGGRTTINSFGYANINEFYATGGLADLIGGDKLAFLKNLKLHVRFGKIVFVHAGWDPSKKDEDQAEHVKLWSRQLFNGPYLDDTCIVHGHTPVLNFLDIKPTPYAPRRVNLDGGCVYGGHLLAARFDDENKPAISKLFKVKGIERG